MEVQYSFQWTFAGFQVRPSLVSFSIALVSVAILLRSGGFFGGTCSGHHT